VGTAAAALVAVALAVAPAHATPCTGTTVSGDRFPICFDIGNRLSLTAGSEGFGGGIALRHIIKFDDEPDLVWKMQHGLLEAQHAAIAHELTATFYRGYYVRHARDGHLVFGERKLFLPFDIGALFEVGTVRWTDAMTAHLGVVKTAALVDLARTRDFHARFAIGPVATWAVELIRDPLAVTEHVVAPFSSGLANVHLESSDGLYALDLRLEAGAAWHTASGWRRDAIGQVSLERILLAINDHPIALTLDARYESLTHEGTAGVGMRIAIFHAADPRVASLH
jgi:hypothetical protein